MGGTARYRRSIDPCSHPDPPSSNGGSLYLGLRQKEQGIMTFDQQEFDIRCEWGAHGIAVLAPVSDVIIIIDVLSFSTSVDVAVAQGAMVFPYRWRDDTALAYATSVGATLADPGRH